MKNNNITRRVLIFLLLALVICLLANINQLVGLLTNDLPPSPRHHMRPPRNFDMMRYRLIWEFIFSFVASFMLITFNSGMAQKQQKRREYKPKIIITISILAGIFMFVLLFATLIPNWRFGSRFSYIFISKSMFVLATSIAIGQLYRLIWQKQQIILENQMLKTDNIQSRYTGLMEQLNPHFLFNSLNSLAALIRDDAKDKALNFIDELSSIYRYVLQRRSNELVTLDEELQFTEAYRYLLRIRFESKLIININVANDDKQRKVPFLTLQPLIENAVKHNAISLKQPLTIDIYTKDGFLTVCNPIFSKLDTESSTGIGLTNLNNRYKLLAGCNIEIKNDGKTFTVNMPLL